tara:strand:+ start:3679 stop:6531 length:2853 start_codon:yes stop_codon:yes gene_type:complete
MNKKLPYKDLADTVASRGRYGDTTLIHVNPIEVEGLASLMPLTRNPDTGYPEAFLPLLAPFIGTALGSALGAGAGLSGLALTAAGAGGSALATTAATGSVEEGLLAGLTGFGLGSAMQGAGNVLGTQGAEAAIAQNLTPDALANTANLPDLGKNLVGGDKLLSTQAEAALNALPTNTIPQSTEAFVNRFGGDAISKGVPNTTADIAKEAYASAPRDLSLFGQEGGTKAFLGQTLKPSNLIPTAAGLGGIAVEQDRKAFEQANQFAKDERVRKREQALRDYQEQIPGVSTLPTPGYAPGLNNNYAQSPSIGRGNIFGAEGGRVKRMRFKNAGDVNIPGLTYNEDGTINYNGQTINTDGSIVNTGGSTVNTGGSTVTTGPTTTAETASAPNAPPSSDWLMTPAYDPYSGTGTRGRGLAPTPLNYMAGFMPEYQYVTNIQPTATSLGALGAGGSYQTPFGTIEVPTTEGNVSVAQEDPSEYVGGSAYNEYLLGNQAKGMPSYLDSYLQNQPYYRYQDQVLNDIWGGGGYGTPDFMGYDPYGGSPIMPQPVNPVNPVNPLQSEVDSLNSRINDLLTQIEGKDSTIAEELAKDQASQFGASTADPKSNLIIQDGDLAGKLNIDSDLFDYLDISPEDKAGIQEYNYIPGYEHFMSAYEGDNLTEQINSYINQETANLGGLNTEVSADDAYIPQNTFDENLGAVVNEIKQEDGSYKEWAVIPNKGYVEVGSFTIDADGNKVYADKKYADGGRVRYAEGRDVEISTLEDYMQPLPFNPADRFVGSDTLDPSKFDASLDTNIDPNIEVDQVETLMQNPVIQEKMSEGDRELLRNASYVILGRLEDDGSVIQRFVEMFGEEAYERLKSELMPEGEQNIGLIEGEGGGMDDMVDGQLGDQQKVALSPGEYILPADVVSDLGDGNNEQGAAIMDDFMERVRVSKHGTTEQPDPINLDSVMPV